MNKEKISSQEIIDLVATKDSVSKRSAEEFLKVMIATIEGALVAGEVVKIRNFGTFKLQWNEPRKSVNVQTGEDILIQGYYKVTFTPDSVLKNLVNEPFAHLEPVQLDENVEKEFENEVEDVSGPLRVFTEQASEIKSLISEINALSMSSKLKDTEDQEESEEFEDQETEDEQSEKQEEIIIKDYEFEQTEIAPADNLESRNEAATTDSDLTEKVEAEIPTVSLTEINSTAFVDKSKSHKRTNRKKWLSVLYVFLFLLFCVLSLYVLYPPATDAGNKVVVKIESVFQHFKNGFLAKNAVVDVPQGAVSMSEQLMTVENEEILKGSNASDSLSVEPLKDSLQILFDTPRVYPEFIASERIVRGSRLARISERYYGTSVFWVYIYEANMDRFGNPDQIPSGAMIYIPKLDPRLIDATNPRCINKAKELHDLYVIRP